jgi:hypothetical protein
VLPDYSQIALSHEPRVCGRQSNYGRQELKEKGHTRQGKRIKRYRKRLRQILPLRQRSLYHVQGGMADMKKLLDFMGSKWMILESW